MHEPKPAKRWETPLRLLALFALLWVFLVCINGLSTSIEGFGGGKADTIFSAADNPIVGLMMGMLVTCLVQSSSTTTSLIVGLVASGELSAAAAVPMVMGANIGTTITNTLVSMGSITRSDEFKRSFAAANIHDIFNVSAVAVLLPLQVLFGVISRPAHALADLLLGTAVDKPSSPIKAHFKGVVHGIESGLDSLFPPWMANLLLLLLSIGFMILALYLIVRTMKGVIVRRAEIFFDHMLGKSALAGMTFGTAVTASVQSSSVTTSLLVPLAGTGAASLRTIFPITLGCNIGTTITALLASIGTGSNEALTIAICHLLFNILGILLIYPFPPTRNLTIRAAEWLAEHCTRNKLIAPTYVIGVFLLLPGVILLIQNLLGGA